MTYDATDFLEKNRDQLHADLIQAVRATRSRFVRALFPASMGHRAAGRGRAAAAGHGATKLALKSVSAQFKTQLGELVAQVSGCAIHFVRCIKTNSARKPRLFDKQEVLSQVVCSGVLDAVKTMRATFPTRIDHAEFLRHFSTFEWRTYMQRTAAGTAQLAAADAAQARAHEDEGERFKSLQEACARLQEALGLGLGPGSRKLLGGAFFFVSAPGSICKTRGACMLCVFLQCERPTTPLRSPRACACLS